MGNFCSCCRKSDQEDGDGQGPKSGNETSRDNPVKVAPKSANEVHPDKFVDIPSHNLRLVYRALTRRGHYPDSPDKENQDSFCIKTELQGNPNLHFFGVFDGHGQFGTQCSNFVRDRLVEILANDPTLPLDPEKAYNSAFLAVNSELHGSDIDDTMSGTASITVLVRGDTLFLANVGDSKAVIAEKNGNDVIAHDLSDDQTPFRKDECERVKGCGARVLSVDQVEGHKDPDIQARRYGEKDEGDSPRLWVKNGNYPGTAFTRSIGDSTAEKIGVTAVPEISVVQLTQNHLFFVVASGGVFEFLTSQATSQAVVDMVVRYSNCRAAFDAIANEFHRPWSEHENQTDDMTIIIVHIRDLRNDSGGVTTTDGARINIKSSPSAKGKVPAIVSTSIGSDMDPHSLKSEFSAVTKSGAGCISDKQQEKCRGSPELAPHDYARHTKDQSAERHDAPYPILQHSNFSCKETVQKSNI